MRTPTDNELDFPVIEYDEPDEWKEHLCRNVDLEDDWLDELDQRRTIQDIRQDLY